METEKESEREVQFNESIKQKAELPDCVLFRGTHNKLRETDK